MGALLRRRELGAPPGAELRLRAVFGQSAFWEADQIARVIRLVVLKGHDQDLQTTVDSAIGEWLSRLEPWSPPVKPDEDELKAEAERKAAQKRDPQMPTSMVVAGFVGIFVHIAVLAALLPDPPPKPTPPPRPTVEAERPATDIQRECNPLKSVPAPKIERIARPSVRRRKPLDALPILAGLLGLALIWRQRQRLLGAPPASAAPEPSPPPQAPAAHPGGLRLLDEATGRHMTYGVERYRAEGEDDILDLAATIAATARGGGMPHLVFEQPKRDRAVWIWVDENALDDHPELDAYADEVVARLRRAGLEGRKATFELDPLVLVDSKGRKLLADDLDAARQTAMVAVLTDGRLLKTLQHRADVSRSLARLCDWERICFFDPSAGAEGLGAVVDDRRIRRMTLPELPGWLGGSAQRALEEQPDWLRWAAACTLAPNDVAETTALALATQLDIPVTGLHIDALLKHTGGQRHGARLHWPTAERRRLLEWLCTAGAELERARAYWQGHYRAEAEAANTRHARAALLHAESLGLWSHDLDTVRAAARTLYQERRAQPEVARAALQCLAPRDDADSHHLLLPWHAAAFKVVFAPEWVMLQELGLGARTRHPSLQAQRPGRVWLAIGACLGAIIVGALALALSPMHPDDAPMGIIEIGDRPERGVLSRTVGGVNAGTRIALRLIPETPGHDVRVEWGANTLLCESSTKDWTIWSCGAVADPPIPTSGTRRLPEYSAAYLDATSANANARCLATALLDSGAVDQVFFSTRPGVSLARATLERKGQHLWVTATERLSSKGTTNVVESDWRYLAEQVGGGALRPVREVWAGAQISGPAADLPTTGCVDGARQVADGVAYRRVCGDTFKMDWNGDSPYTATVSDFWLGETEVTVAQYRACVEAKKCEAPRQGEQCNWAVADRDDHPVNCVSWEDATAFAKFAKARLPSEAEWEFAARSGGREQTYPWGNQEPSCDLAIYENEDGKGCGKKATWPTCSRTRGNSRQGLCDLAGNTWEWVQDCYAGYPVDGANALNTSAESEARCGLRVLRGGSFWNATRLLRASRRDWVRPAHRDRVVGFRVCRGLPLHRRLIPLTKGGRSLPSP